MKVLCAVCEAEFDAKRSTARFCSATCRQRSKRGTSVSAGDPDSGLVASVEQRLTEAHRLDTVSGQLAVALAKQVTAVGATGIASLSKELRQVMAEALDGIAPPEDEVEDEVDKARKAREHKASAAAHRA